MLSVSKRIPILVRAGASLVSLMAMAATASLCQNRPADCSRIFCVLGLNSHRRCVRWDRCCGPVCSLLLLLRKQGRGPGTRRAVSTAAWVQDNKAEVPAHHQVINALAEAFLATEKRVCTSEELDTRNSGTTASVAYLQVRSALHAIKEVPQ